MKLVVPDGKKIAELRRDKGIKQVTLAHDGGISDRLLRDVEKKDRRISEHHLVNIATALGVQPSSIRKILYLVKNANDKVPDITTSPFGLLRMRLKPIHSAGDLFRMADEATWMHYDLLVDPTRESAPAIIDLLSILKHKVGDEYNFRDGYEKGNFSDIMRMARLNELLSDFAGINIIILANTYVRRAWKNTYYDYQVVPEVRLHLCLCSANSGEQYVYIEDDDEEAKKQSKYADLEANLDDDIPF